MFCTRVPPSAPVLSERGSAGRAPGLPARQCNIGDEFDGRTLALGARGTGSNSLVPDTGIAGGGPGGPRFESGRSDMRVTVYKTTRG